jgi:hypothetical protein
MFRSKGYAQTGRVSGLAPLKSVPPWLLARSAAGRRQCSKIFLQFILTEPLEI